MRAQCGADAAEASIHPRVEKAQGANLRHAGLLDLDGISGAVENSASRPDRPVFVDEPAEIVVVTICTYYFRLAMEIGYDVEVDARSDAFREVAVTTKPLAEGIAAFHSVD